MQRFGFRATLIAWLLLVGILPVMIWSSYASRAVRDRLAHHDADRFTEQADAIIVRVMQRFSAAQSDLRIASEQMGQLFTGAPSRSKSTLESAARVLSVWRPEMTLIEKGDSSRVLVVHGRVADDPASPFERLLVNAIPDSQDGAPGIGVWAVSNDPAVLTLAMGVVVSGRVVGVLYRSIPAQEFWPEAEVGGRFLTAWWVLDAEGRIISTRGDPAGSFRTLAEPGARTERGDALTTTRATIDGVPTLIAQRRVDQESFHGTIGLAVPLAGGEVHAFGNRLLWAVVLLVATLIPLAWFAAGLMARPFRRLDAVARRIAQGERDVDPDVGRWREVRHVAESVHRMGYDLKRAEERLAKTERLAVIGATSVAACHQLAAQVAEVRKPVESLLAQDGLPSEVRGRVELISDGLARMKDCLAGAEQVPRSPDPPSDESAVGAVAVSGRANPSGGDG